MELDLWGRGGENWVHFSKTIKEPFLKRLLLFGWFVKRLCWREHTGISLTIKLEENLLDGIKVEKVDTQANGYEEALGEILSPLVKALMCLLRMVVNPRIIRLV